MGDDITFEQEQPTVLNLRQKIIKIQRRLRAPKSNYNSFSNFSYRSCEDILEGLKPLLEEYDVLLVCNDEPVFIEGRFYIKTTVAARDAVTGDVITAVGYAREPESKAKFDSSQVTGSAASYACKRALGNLFAIDDTKDADSDGTAQPTRATAQPARKEPPVGENFVARCTNCGTAYTFNDVDYYRSFIMSPGCCENPHWVVQ